MMTEEQWNSLRQQPVEHAIIALLSHMLQETEQYMYQPKQNSLNWDSIQVTFRDFEVSVRRRNTGLLSGAIGRLPSGTPTTLGS